MTNLNDREMRIAIIRYLELNGHSDPSVVADISDQDIQKIVGQLAAFFGVGDEGKPRVEDLVLRQMSEWREELASAMVSPGARVKDHSWVPKTVTNNAGMFATFLHGLSMQSWDESDVARLRWSVLSTLGATGDPNTPGRTRGLVVGRVQSGKTTHYISLILAALIAGYRRILVLGGHTNSLRAQCQRRIRNAIDSLTTQGVAFTSPEFVTGSQEDGDLTARTAYSNESDRAQIFVCKKNTSPLGEFLKTLGTSAVPLLIIDDEADWGTQNVSSDPEQEQTRINQLISDIIRTQATSAAHRAYVAYTATPNANLLVSEDDAGAIMPEFVKVLTPGKGYLGNDAIVGAEDSEMLPIFCDRNRDDPRRTALQNIDQGIIDDLHKGIRYFLLAAAGYRFIAAQVKGGVTKPRARMLINDSTLKDHHMLIFGHVSSLLKKVTTSILIEDDGEMCVLRKIWENDYQKNWGEFQKRLGNISVDAPSWSDLEDHLSDVAGALMPEHGNQDKRIRIVNSDHDALMAALASDKGREVIYVGGMVFSRGVTLENLSTVIFAASANQRDTLLQYARWLGYRGDYAPLLRVLLPKIDKEAYAQVARLDRKLWEFLQHACDQRLNPAEAQIVVPQENDGLRLRPTSLSKMRLAVMTLESRMVEPVVWEPNEISYRDAHIWIDAALELIENSPELERPESRAKFFRPTSQDMLDYLRALAGTSDQGRDRMAQLLKALQSTGEMAWVVAVPMTSGPPHKEQDDVVMSFTQALGANPRVATRAVENDGMVKRTGGNFSGSRDRKMDFKLRRTNTTSVKMAIKSAAETQRKKSDNNDIWNDEGELWRAPNLLATETLAVAKEHIVSLLREDLRRKALAQAWDRWLRRPGEAFCVIQAFHLSETGHIILPSLVTPRAESSTFGMVPRERQRGA